MLRIRQKLVVCSFGSISKLESFQLRIVSFIPSIQTRVNIVMGRGFPLSFRVVSNSTLYTQEIVQGHCSSTF